MPNRPDRDDHGRYKSRIRSDSGHQAHESRLGTVIRRIYWRCYDFYHWLKPW
ncbi:hypothetical protein [Halorubrum lacusprofundi]|uniref:hypothetical protein n=1 Tax=Halorubrum lacusprofundi TaxID=2247 RepID=UPI00197A7821|nr:hypothetical protein [Halorubrum lacusprofundi]MCG1008106.1 hypothetical protein [Halorubrum lacusprofundi]